MPGLTGGDNVWGGTGYTTVITVKGTALEVCLDREQNMPGEVKLKYFKAHNVAQLPLTHLEISSTYKTLSDISNSENGIQMKRF